MRLCRGPHQQPAKRALTRRSALAYIECNCIYLVFAEDDGGWWDIAIAPNDLGADEVAAGVSYLERKGLLVIHPHCDTWIRILDSAT